MMHDKIVAVQATSVEFRFWKSFIFERYSLSKCCANIKKVTDRKPIKIKILELSTIDVEFASTSVSKLVNVSTVKK
jgi:hypothetical protein